MLEKHSRPVSTYVIAASGWESSAAALRFRASDHFRAVDCGDEPFLEDASFHLKLYRKADAGPPPTAT
ncbi:MAG TPA: hypothetical protein VEK15_28615 [Vicinamibacteria bacterium]|nr:hypothetical protein [Vicinamibacteria bacterium]